MADKIDKSLEELIKTNKGRGGMRGGGMRRGTGGAVARGMRRSGPAMNFRRSGPAGGIQKRRSAGNSPNKAAFQTAASSVNGQWSHDLYQNGGGGAAASAGVGGGGGNFRRNAITGGATGPAKLVISNLDFGVNDSDIEGLFQEFGKIKKAAVHYDRSGRSLGTADVMFDRKADAIRALTHYNGVSLDGRPMNIQLTTSLGVFNGGQRQNIGGNAPLTGGNGVPRRGGGGAGGGRGGNRRGVGRGGRGGRGGGFRGPPKSAADLDADLDAHQAKMQTD